MSRGSPFIAALALAALSGCGPSKPPEVPATGGPWTASTDAGHPLVGRIWDPKKATFVASEDLIARASVASFVFLGEKHDHADHHRLQARVLKGVVRARRTPMLAVEMIDVDEQDKVAAAPSEPEAFAAAVGWDARGFAPFASYKPVFEVALAAELRVEGVNLPRAQAKAIARGGLSVLDEATRRRLALDAPVPADEEKQREDEIRVAHCDHLPVQLLPTMADAQRARDAQMAERMASVPPSQGAVLIAGVGHVRLDRGAPKHLALRLPGASMMSIAFIEVDRDKNEPQAYGDLPFDAVWFTPRLDDLDPCRAFRKRSAPAAP